jgi:hypothetical protein
MAVKVHSLYTTDDVKRVRKRLLEQQRYIDPITKQRLVDGASTTLDHQHSSQHCRAALHRNSNTFEGLVYNAYKRCLQWSTDVPLPTILRNLADYYEVDYSSNPYHKDWMKRVQIDFKKLTASQQNKVLINLGSTEGSNGADRLKLFKVLTLNRTLGYDTIRDMLLEVSSFN